MKVTQCDLVAAEQILSKAIQQDYNSADGILALSTLYTVMDRFQEAEVCVNESS